MGLFAYRDMIQLGTFSIIFVAFTLFLDKGSGYTWYYLPSKSGQDNRAGQRNNI